MFTGIIEGLGTIRELTAAGEGRRMTVEADFDLAGTRIGDSIAVNGACLTAVSLAGRRFTVDVAPETVARSRFKIARVGERVNLERALTLASRLDGHIVTGHVDGEGRILSRETRSNAMIITIGVDPFLARYLIPKGSVAVDGTSLTVNTCERDRFTVSIIPHTAGLSSVGTRETGESVNIETDIVGKYIERFLLMPGRAEKEKPVSSGIDLSFLAKNGFL
ncbi:riboflavin synthase [Desulfobotulus sp. H1]|uniref:Riboflavin synthase n=1 Tax=Desulfobotulus pelophilus TaxID=2823377 RepID=A0ABT3N6Z0_9BACT|nr:riboflavin synthase [Desulfobotulus pelophilus]MCW7753223.1 riboflavin synthase [Desulfobotulus pelophilus]